MDQAIKTNVILLNIPNPHNYGKFGLWKSEMGIFYEDFTRAASRLDIYNGSMYCTADAPRVLKPFYAAL